MLAGISKPSIFPAGWKGPDPGRRRGHRRDRGQAAVAYSSGNRARRGPLARPNTAANRPTPAVFYCPSCGVHLNADLDGARNIAVKSTLAGSGNADVGGQPVKLPIVTEGQGPLVRSPRLLA